MSKIFPPFGAADFDAYANRNTLIRISLKDTNCNWLSPPFTKGYFAIAPYAGQPFIFDRNTDGVYVRFTSFVAGQWYLDADIIPTDTVTLRPGMYYYEARLDFAAGQYELKSGLFLLRATYI